jgi:hypothetical protein
VAGPELVGLRNVVLTNMRLALLQRYGLIDGDAQDGPPHGDVVVFDAGRVVGRKATA